MKTIFCLFLMLIVFLFYTDCWSAGAESVTNAKSSPSRLWNLQDADILSVINEVSLETGKNFIVDPRVTGKISLISSKPIKPNEVYHLFLSVLELLGYSAIPSGNVVKIVPNMESSELATRVANRITPGKGDEVVVRVFPLENVSANQLIPIIRPMLPQWSNVSAYMPGNVLIIIGRAANLQRIDQVIRNVDKASNSDIDIVHLHYASASQLVIVLNNLQNAARSAGEIPQVSIAADERSNSILLSGNKASRFRMHQLINELDAPKNGANGNTEVIYLRYLQAKNFAPILGKIAQNILGKETQNSTATNSTTTQSTTLENKTSIQAEPSTNSLIITAPPALMSTLSAIVAKLDIRPAQVLVEGIIVEIDQDDLKNLGIQWGSLAVNNNAGIPNTTPQGQATFAPLGLGSIGIIPGTQIQAILGALQSKTGADILSTPSIVVLDNQKALLSVGTQVPEQSGSYATTGNAATVNPFNTINRLNVDLKLEVTPQINLGNAVRLSIGLKNDSLQNPDNPGLNPITNTSEIKNSVLVNSTDVLVLGGLISNNITQSVEKVPILGDIPLIGKLFQHNSRRSTKRNLMVFIKPTILYTENDSNAITNTKYDLIRRVQINWPENLSDPAKQKVDNILPLRNNTVTLPKPFEKSDSNDG